ncbi:hypothetical protein HYS28_00800 [Candidatus Uhrbacteria bacterium]|nr:hypothetical protein [Candidatus Uhrbacteria bacterium]
MNTEAGRFRTGAANEERKALAAEALSEMYRHPLIIAAKPELLGEGGMHAVFTLENQEGVPRGIVAKVHRIHLLRSLNERTKAPPGTPKEEVARRQRLLLARELRKEQGSVRTAKQYFAPYMLHERIRIMDIPVTDETLQTLAGQDAVLPRLTRGTHEFPTIVTLQERAPDAAFGPGSHGIQMKYVEKATGVTAIDGQDYADMNASYLDCAPNPDSYVGVPMMARDAGVEEFVETAKNDPELRKELVAFLRSAMAFSQETGGLVDFIGTNNVRAFKENDRWRVLMVDGRISGGIFAKGKAAVRAMLERTPLTDDEIFDALFAVNYTRFVNAVAAELGMTERLRLLDVPLAPHSERMLSYFQMLFTVPKTEAASAEQAAK